MARDGFGVCSTIVRRYRQPTHFIGVIAVMPDQASAPLSNSVARVAPAVASF